MEGVQNQDQDQPSTSLVAGGSTTNGWSADEDMDTENESAGTLCTIDADQLDEYLKELNRQRISSSGESMSEDPWAWSLLIPVDDRISPNDCLFEDSFVDPFKEVKKEERPVDEDVLLEYGLLDISIEGEVRKLDHRLSDQSCPDLVVGDLIDLSDEDSAETPMQGEDKEAAVGEYGGGNGKSSDDVEGLDEIMPPDYYVELTPQEEMELLAQQSWMSLREMEREEGRVFLERGSEILDEEECLEIISEQVANAVLKDSSEESDTASQASSDVKQQKCMGDIEFQDTPSDIESQNIPIDIKSQETPSNIKSEDTTSDFKSQDTPSDNKSENTPSDIKSEDTPQDTPSDIKSQDTPSDIKIDECATTTKSQKQASVEEHKSSNGRAPTRGRRKPEVPSGGILKKSRGQQQSAESINFAPNSGAYHVGADQLTNGRAAEGNEKSFEVKCKKNGGHTRSKAKKAKTEDVPKVALPKFFKTTYTPSKSSSAFGPTPSDETVFKPTIYVDFGNEELRNIVAKKRLEDAATLEAATKSKRPWQCLPAQQYTVNTFNPRPKLRQPFQIQPKSQSAPTSTSSWPVVPPPLNILYNTPKTRIEEYQEYLRNPSYGNRPARTFDADAKLPSAGIPRTGKQVEIPSLMSLDLTKPAEMKEETNSKKRALKVEISGSNPKNPAGNQGSYQENYEVPPAPSVQPPVVWTGHPVSLSPTGNAPKSQPQESDTSSESEEEVPATREYNFSGIKPEPEQPVKRLSSHEVSAAMNEGRKVEYDCRDCVLKRLPQKLRRAKAYTVKPGGKDIFETHNRPSGAVSSGSDSSISESSKACRPKQPPVGYERSQINRNKAYDAKTNGPKHANAENRRVAELRRSGSKMIQAATAESFNSPHQDDAVREVVEGHKCLFKRCKSKVGTLVMNRAEATKAMTDHLWRHHRVKIDKGEDGYFVLAMDLEKLVEKLRDRQKGTTEVLSLLKHGNFIFALKGGVGLEDELFYFELVYLMGDDDVEVDSDIFVNHGFEIVRGTGMENDVELRGIPFTVWDPTKPIVDNAVNLRNISVKDLKENFLFDGTIRMAFRVFAIYTSSAPSSPAGVSNEEGELDDVEMAEAEDYIQRCKDTTFFGKPSRN